MENNQMGNGQVANDQMTNGQVTNGQVTNDQMENNQMGNEQATEQISHNSGQMNMPNMVLPFNGDTKKFRANLPNIENMSIGGAPLQPGMQMQNPQVAQGQPIVHPPKKKHIGLLVAILVAVVLIAGTVSSYFLFLTPEKRFERAMRKAEIAFEDGDYDAAVSYYEKALDIHEDEFDAIYGLLQAESLLGDTKALQKDYTEFRDSIFSQDATELQQNMQETIDIILLCQQVYSGDADRIVEELEAGFDYVGDNEKLLAAWISVKLSQAEAIKESDAEAALLIYSSILDYSNDNEQAVNGFTDCWKELVNGYLASYSYEPAQVLLDTYKGKVQTINFTDYQSQINKAKTISEQGIPLMEKAYSAMETNDYVQMCEIDLGSETEQFLPYVNESFIWAPEGFTEDYTGIAIGLYKHTYSELSGVENYFYYGEYVNGERVGQGKAFYGVDLNTCEYELFEGTWDNDKPNGYGVSGDYNCYYEDSNEYTSTEKSGNFIDGYADGEINVTLTSSEGYTVAGTFTATMGEAEDIRDQYSYIDFVGYDDRDIYVVMESEEVTWWLSKNKKAKIRAATWIE